MNTTQLPSKNSVAEKAAALQARMAACSTQPELVSKVASTRNVDCNADEFNIWHAAKDNNSARTPWGTLPTGRN